MAAEQTLVARLGLLDTQTIFLQLSKYGTPIQEVC